MENQGDFKYGTDCKNENWGQVDTVSSVAEFVEKYILV